MGKNSKQTVTQSIDPKMAAFRDFAFGRAQALGNQTIDPSLQAGFEQLATIDPAVQAELQGLVGNLGMASGAFQRFAGGISPEDIARFQDPYQKQVTAATMEDFTRLRANALNEVGSEATRAGAFGGSRQGIAEGTVIGELGRAEASVLGDIRSRGFQSAVQNALSSRGQAMGAAGQLANLGFGGISGLEQLISRSGAAQLGLGQARQNLPFQILGAQQGILGSSPFGMTETTETEGSPWQALLGAGALGASILFPPAAPAIAAGSQIFSGGSGPLTALG